MSTFLSILLLLVPFITAAPTPEADWPDLDIAQFIGLINIFDGTSKLIQSVHSASASFTTGTSTLPVSSSTSTAAYFAPTAGTSWNIELANVPDASAASDAAYYAWDYDMADAPNATIAAFKAAGHKVICYFSAGSVESYRSDAGQFPSAAIGKVMEGWKDEHWVDTRNAGVRQLMKNRIALAKAKGCDGVDPDNIDGYDNDTGFDLSEDDGVDYVNFLAQTAHDAGLAYGLKNGGSIVDRVVDVAQWCIQEQCHIYQVSDNGPSECSLYRAFIDANKPVFNIEYTKDEPASAKFVKQSCSADLEAKGFSVLIKHMSLDGWTELCPPS